MPTGAQPPAVPIGTGPRRRSRAVLRATEYSINASLACCAALSVFTTFAIIAVLVKETREFFLTPDASLWEFLLTTRWEPALGSEKHFGIWPLIAGTMLVTAVAAAVALPLGLATAIFLSEYAPRRLRACLKPVLEVLAGVPTVVYGYFALTAITPSLMTIQDRVVTPIGEHLGDSLRAIVARPIDSYNALSAGIAVGIMTLPIVSSLSEDALQAVPRSLREGAYAVGGTRFDVSTRVVVPAALSGIMASFLLAIARAVGETMIVALAAGGLAQLTADPRDQVQTMTGYIVQIFGGDAEAHGVAYYACYAVAFTLFLLTLGITLVGRSILRRFREEYE